MKVSITALIVTLGFLGTASFADDSTKGSTTKKMSEPSAEQRQKMAELHEKMAVCLKSTRPIEDCHQEMLKACQNTMSKDSCPMMGGGMNHGMMHKHMHGATSSGAAADQEGKQ